MKFFKKTSVISCYHFSSFLPRGKKPLCVTLSAVTGGSCRSLASTVPILFRYPFGAPLRSHLLYLSVPFLSALRNVLCKTSMINTIFLIAFAYSYSSTGNPDCQCSFVSLLLITAHYSSSFSPSIKTEYAGSVTAVPSRLALSSPV